MLQRIRESDTRQNLTLLRGDGSVRERVPDDLQTTSCAHRFALVPTMIYIRPFINTCVQDVGQSREKGESGEMITSSGGMDGRKEGRFRMKEMQEKCYSSGRTTTESLESVLRVERLVSEVNA